MNQEIYTIDEHTVSVHRAQTPASYEPTDHQIRRYIDAELSRVVARLLAELQLQPAEHVTRTTRQMLLYIGNRYHGSESRKFAEYLRGLHLMSQLHFRAALAAFERVLLGQVEPEFEVFREMALQSHSVCLEQLGFDELSMERFTEFLYRKFEETRANEGPDDVAYLLGLGRVEASIRG